MQGVLIVAVAIVRGDATSVPQGGMSRVASLVPEKTLRHKEL